MKPSTAQVVQVLSCGPLSRNMSDLQISVSFKENCTEITLNLQCFSFSVPCSFFGEFGAILKIFSSKGFISI